MKYVKKQFSEIRTRGFVLVLAVVGVLLLSILGISLLRMAYGAKLRAINIKYEALTRLTAEAGYEAAIDWMNSVDDVYSNLIISIGTSGRLSGGRSSGGRATEHVVNSSASYFESNSGDFPSSSFKSRISFDGFLGSRAIYKVVSDAYSSKIRTRNFSIVPGTTGLFHRKVNTRVIRQIEMSGWDMGICRRPDGFLRVNEKAVPFSKKDIIDMPIHINCDANPYPVPDDQNRDIYISSKPSFKRKVFMGESRYWRLGGNKDKYKKIMKHFKKGIYFDQPDSGIIDNAYNVGENNSIKWKVDRFIQSTKSEFSFKPAADTNLVAESQAAVQLEFYLNNRKEGMVRITNNCTVHYLKGGGAYDYELANGDVARDYKKHDIYAYHYINLAETPVNRKITDSYVQHVAATMSGTSARSDSGGQIFVNGNVIIGGAVDNNGKIDINGVLYQTAVKGRLTVVATGNIWIANSVEYADGQNEQYDKKGFLVKKVPKFDNPNVLALFSQYGVVQIVDPSLSSAGPPKYAGVLDYSPIGIQASAVDPNIRELPQALVVQGAITAGGGSWGAENIGIRKNTNKKGKDNLVFAGTICEVFRGVVCEDEISGKSNNGYQKYYYFDDRMVNGIPYGRKMTYGIPGDMWLQRKYVPIAGGWSDSRL